MKNFFKKLSFVLASAMVITSLYAPANAEAAAKNYVRVKGSKAQVTSKVVFVGGRKVNFDYTIGKKTVGVPGTWSSSNKKVAVVDKKTGLVTAVGNGKAVITYKTKKATLKTTVYGRTRAESVKFDVAENTVVKVGKESSFEAMFTLSDKIVKAGGKETTYKLYAEVDNAEAATVKVDGAKVLVTGVKPAKEVTVKVVAAQQNTMEKAKADKYKIETEFKVLVVADITAEQGSGNTVKVKGTNLSTDPAMYVIKNARTVTFPLAKDGLKVNEEKTEAVLTTESLKLAKGDYTLTYDKNATANFTVEDIKVKSFEFAPEGKAQLVKVGVYKVSANTAKVDMKLGARIYYKVLDQFGNDITNNTNLYKMNVVASSHYEHKKGQVTIYNLNKDGFTAATTSGTGLADSKLKEYNAYVDKVYISLVDLSGSGVSKSGEFTIYDEEKFDSLNYEGLYDVNKGKIVDSISEGEGASTDKFAVLFTGKNQYGKDMISTDAKLVTALAYANSGITLTNAEDIKKYTINGKDYMGFLLKIPAVPRPGEVTAKAISTGTGKTAEGKFNVVPRVTIDKISIMLGERDIYNKELVKLGYDATDKDGKPITAYNVLKRLNKDNLMSEGLEFVPSKDGKTAELWYSKTRADVKGVNYTTDVLTVRSETYKISTLQVNIYNTRRPVAFLGLKKDFITGITQNADNKLVIKYKDLLFEDQYSNEISADKIVSLHTNKEYGFSVKSDDTAQFDYKIQKSDGSALEAPTTLEAGENYRPILGGETVFVEATIKNVAGTTGTADLVFQLGTANSTNDSYVAAEKDKLGQEKKIKLYNVVLADLNGFDVDEKGLKSVGDLDNDPKTEANLRTYVYRPTVYGYYNGEKVNLYNVADADINKSDYMIREGVDFVAPGKKNVNIESTDMNGGYYVKVPNKASIKGTDTTAKEKYTVVVKGAKEFTKEYEYGKSPRTVTTLKRLFGDRIEATGISNKEVTWEKSSQYELKSKFIVLDQYDFASEVKPYVTFEFDDPDQVEVHNNGYQNAYFTINNGITDPVVVIVKLTFPNSTLEEYAVLKLKK